MTHVAVQDASVRDAVQAAEADDIRRLDRKLLQGVSWSGGIKGLTQPTPSVEVFSLYGRRHGERRARERRLRLQ